jgi:DNA-binding MarR family transcriptional regulator
MEAASPSRARVPAEPTAADRELALKLGSLMLHVLNPAADSTFRVIDESGLSFVQTKGLLALATSESEHLSVKLLAEQLNISLPSASRAVDELVRAKLVTREEDPDDRRMRQVALTARGRGLAGEIIAARLEGLERFAASLGRDERRKLAAALDALLEREEIAETYRTYPRASKRR